MSSRENPFNFNPFRNWPFAISPGRPNSHLACTCPTDLNDDRYAVPCGIHLYQPGLVFDSGPHRQVPSVKITRPEEDTSKPAEKKTAIDALKACSTLKVKKITQKADAKARLSEASSSSKMATSNDFGRESNKENEPNTSQSAASDSHYGQLSMRPQNEVVNRSVSMSTIDSFGRATVSSWKNSLASGSQTTLSSMDGAEKDYKGKAKAVWQSESPISNSHDSGVMYNHGTPTEKASAFTPTTDGNLQLQGATDPHATLEYGKMVLGCSQCLFDPKLRVVPCGCLVCTQCGGRFWGTVSTGSEVYCGCGERVTNMLKLELVGPEQAGHGVYSQQSVYLPAVPFASPASSTGAVQFSPAANSLYKTSTKSEQIPVIGAQPFVPTRAHPVSTQPTLDMSLSVQLASPNMSRMLMMDAETAIQNAPFVELGRNSLAQNWSCVKIGNIPYNVSSEELLEFLGKNSNIVPEVAGSIGIHVIMDRSTGKTMDAYVEFVNPKDAYKCVSRRRSRVLGNRHLSLDVVDPSELMKDVFPRAKGIFWDGVIPIPSQDKSEFGAKTEIISREELVLIVNHARTPHRSPFSRKCLQRPFQSLMSIVSKFPWFAVSLYTIQQRDYIFQALLSAVDILKRQIKRGRTIPNLDIELLKSLLHVGIRCAGFTDAQKYELVKTAEFGAEGIQVDADIGILSGFEALGKAVGAERKVLEFYSLLLELSASPFLGEPSAHGLSAADLIRAKNLTKQHPEESKKSSLTMADASALEWATIEKAVCTVLPGKLSLLKNHNKASAGPILAGRQATVNV